MASALRRRIGLVERVAPRASRRVMQALLAAKETRAEMLAMNDNEMETFLAVVRTACAVEMA